MTIDDGKIGHSPPVGESSRNFEGSIGAFYTFRRICIIDRSDPRLIGTATLPPILARQTPTVLAHAAVDHATEDAVIDAAVNTTVNVFPLKPKHFDQRYKCVAVIPRLADFSPLPGVRFLS